MMRFDPNDIIKLDRAIQTLDEDIELACPYVTSVGFVREEDNLLFVWAMIINHRTSQPAFRTPIWLRAAGATLEGEVLDAPVM